MMGIGELLSQNADIIIRALSAFLQILLAVAVCAKIFLVPRRSSRRQALALILTCVYAAAVSVGAAVLEHGGPDAIRFYWQYAYRVALSVVFIPLIMLIWDGGFWPALACNILGNVIRNFVDCAYFLIAEVISLATGGTVAPGLLSEFVFSLAAYLVIYFLVEIRERVGTTVIWASGLGSSANRQMLVLLATVEVPVIGIEDMTKYLLMLGVVPHEFVVIQLCAEVAVCVFSIYLADALVRKWRLEVSSARLNELLSLSRRQYELSREVIKKLNAQTHELKRLSSRCAATSRALDDAAPALVSLARQADVYDSFANTGNAVLDTVLTERQLMCRSKGIKLTCIADGAAVDFLASADTFTLFSCLLDGAIRTVRANSSEDEQSISLLVRRVNGMVVVHVEYYDDGTLRPNDDLDSVNMEKSIVEEYGGSITASQIGRVYHVNAMIPLRSGSEA